MNNDIPVLATLGGIDESQAFTDQPLASTRESLNMRSVNDSNGREQLSSRSGTGKYVSTQLGNAPVKVAVQISYDAKKMTFAAAASPSETALVPRAKGDILALTVDKQGNCFFVDGKGQVTKTNSDLRVLWTATLPLDDNDLICRAIAVDDAGNIFVGTSAKGTFIAGVATPVNAGAMWPIWFTGATWDEANKRLTKTGLWTNYTFAAGDELYITSGTGAAPGAYPVGAKASNNAIDTIRTIGPAADTQTDIAGFFLAGGGLQAHKNAGDTSGSRIFRLTPVYNDKVDADACAGTQPPSVLISSDWTIDTEGALVEQMKVWGGRLYTAQNDPSKAKSWVVVYDNIGTGVPDEVLRTADDVCPFPINGMDVKDGAFFTCHEPNLHRGEPLDAPNFTRRVTDWTPNDLKDSKKRIWAWYKAEDIVSAGGLPLKDGDPVLVWRDSSGNGRHLTAGAGTWNGYTIKPPVFRSKGLGGLPAVYFDGKKTSTELGGSPVNTVSMLQSGVNETDDPGQKEKQLTICPGYKDSRWLLVMTVRPTVQPTAAIGTIWYQWNNVSGAPAAGHGIHTNAGHSSATAFTAVANRISINDNNTGTAGDGGNAPYGISDVASTALPYSANIYSAPLGVTNVPGAGVLAYLNCGGHADTKSVFYWNGNPIDRWKSRQWRTVNDGTQFSGASVLGLNPKQPTFGAYEGEISEIIVLDDYDAYPITGNNVRVLTHAAYPDTVLSAATIDLELERIIGYAAHRRGLAHLLPTNASKGVGDGSGPAPGNGDSTTVTVSGATWTQASRTITFTNGFRNYNNDAHVVTADMITVLGGTDSTTGLPVKFGIYGVASSTNDTVVIDVGQEIAPNNATGLIVNVHYHNIPHSFPLYVNPSDSTLVGPPRVGGLATASKFADLLHFGPLLVKWEAARGDPKWIVKGSSTIGGIGYGCVVDCSGHVVNIGPRATTSPNEFMRRVLDNGDTATTTASNTAWYLASASGMASAAADASGGNMDYRWPRMAADKFDTIYAPVHDTNPAAGSRSSLLVLHRSDPGGGTPNVADILLEHDCSTSGSVHVAHAVGIDPNIPEFEKATSGNNIFDDSTAYAVKAPRAEFAYVGLRTITQGDSLLRKVKLVDSTPVAAGTSTVSRNTKNLVVVAGDIKTFAAPSTVSSSLATLSSDSQFVSAAAFLQEGFIVDGRSLKVYNPKTGLVADWTSKTAGKIPTRCKLLVQWNSRLVLGRDADSQSAIHFSARRNAYDWDRFPPGIGVVSGQAFSLADPTRGAPNDIVNCLYSWTEDRLLVFGDRSVWVVDGDPTFGGQAHQIPSKWGGSFGRSADQDDQGTVYFFTSQGGVAYLSGGTIRSLTEGRIEKRMQAVNFATNHVQVVWDNTTKRLHVFQEPYGAGGTVLYHWVWERRTNSWREDQFAAASVQPSFAAVFDGDAQADRRLLLFTQGGYANKYDSSLNTDDGTAFVSRELLAIPVPPRSSRYRFTHPRFVFDHSLAAPTAEMIVTDSPSLLGNPFRQVTQEPGTNGYGLGTMRGAFGFLALSGTSRWAYEHGTIRAFPVGRQTA